MSKWTVHIGFGCALCLGAIGIYILFGPAGGYWPAPVGLVTALFAGILGSDFPDFDSRHTKIKYVLGLLVGGFIGMMYLVHIHLDVMPLWDMIGRWELLYARYLLYAFLLFVLFTALNTFLWFLPFRHHGRTHSIVAALLYGLFWGAVGFVFLGLSVWDSLCAAGFGWMGYVSHLVLDLDIKVWK